jgi:hypothetical protein
LGAGGRQEEDEPQQKKKKETNLAEITDVAALQQMLVNNKSRGQRQRITKRIKALRGDAPQNNKQRDPSATSAKDKIEFMMKKREQKLNKKQEVHQHRGLSAEERKIKNEIKSKKRQQNKANQLPDEFDSMLEKYQNKLLKKLKQAPESGATPFQEVEYSD